MAAEGQIGVDAQVPRFASASGLGAVPSDALGRARFERRATDSAPETPRSSGAGSARRIETMRRAAVLRRSLAGADLLASAFALLTVAVLFDHTLRVRTLLLAVVVILAAKLAGLYERDEVRLRKSTLEEVPKLLQLTGLSALLVWFGDGWLLSGTLGREEVAVLWTVTFAAVLFGRLAARRFAAASMPPERCLIVGDPRAASEVTAKIAGRRAEIVGFLPLLERRQRMPAARHDPCAALEDVAQRLRAHRIIVAPGPHGEADVTLQVVSRAQGMGAYVSILPRMCEVVGSSVDFDHVDGLTLLGVHPFGLGRSSRALKRAIDIIGASLALIAASPLIAAAAIAIRLDTRGPVLFRQLRVGHGGRPFVMFKFRSMHDGAHELRAEHAHLSHAGPGTFKVIDDPRITRVGRVLRRFSIDELPQLLNVLRGEMSLVGPRPLIVDEDRHVVGYHRQRLKLTPGMTGPWQVLGTPERRVPLREMVTLDYLYAGNWSLWTDVKILLRTVVHVVRGHGL